ncbi:MAG: hypothetical protein E7176_01580 [Erysipelotrichaceae bacterium]|nr:hypothetical protein [Erysipelotrichaceae bacterium]
MKRFTILMNYFDDSKMVIDVFKSLVGNRLEVKEDEKYLIFDYEFDNIDDINNLFLSLGAELMVNIIGYTSSYEDRLKEEKEVALELIESLTSGMYDIKSALLSLDEIKNKSRILELILESSGIDAEFIRSFSENNLNVSQASKNMFIHRNTMNYKIEKLYELSGFDLKSFIDAYILYTLAK